MSDYSSWNKAKRLEDIEEARRKQLPEYSDSTQCEHDYEIINNTFIKSGYKAYKQCRKCGLYLYTKV